ncbi:MAG: hypothetical protein R3B91_11050 [Planctomycetaceae bacterium]
MLFSSHLLDEVERVAGDTVAMLHNGQLIPQRPTPDRPRLSQPSDLRFAEPCQTKPTLPGALSCDGSGQEWTVICNGQIEELCARCNRTGAEVVEQSRPSLDEVFVARVYHGRFSQGHHEEAHS